MVNYIYFNPQNEQLWIIDYRIYDPDTDKKTKIDHVEEMMLNAIKNKKIPFKTVRTYPKKPGFYSNRT